MMVFPFTVPLDGSGRMLDAAQGVYARSLARTLAERLSEPPRLQANLAQLTADGPLDGENELRGHGWVVASQPWTLEEACHIGLPDGTEFLLHGSAELTDRVRIRILLVDSPQKQLALDHIVLRPRGELFAALDEAAGEIARALGEEAPRFPWPTRDVEAYVAYLRGRDMSAAHEMRVRVADPRRSFEPYLEAMRLDPRFADAQERLLALALDFALGGQGPVSAAREACEKLLAIDSSAFKAQRARPGAAAGVAARLRAHGDRAVAAGPRPGVGPVVRESARGARRRHRRPAGPRSGAGRVRRDGARGGELAEGRGARGVDRAPPRQPRPRPARSRPKGGSARAPCDFAPLAGQASIRAGSAARSVGMAVRWTRSKRALKSRCSRRHRPGQEHWARCALRSSTSCCSW